MLVEVRRYHRYMTRTALNKEDLATCTSITRCGYFITTITTRRVIERINE
jgi:hypothetical protein